MGLRLEGFGKKLGLRVEGVRFRVQGFSGLNLSLRVQGLGDSGIKIT